MNVKIDLRDIPVALKILRKEYERQIEIEKAATPGPWWEHGDGIVSGPRAPSEDESRWGYRDAANGKDVIVTDDGCYPPDNPTKSLICEIRNLNPARLRVADNLLASASGWLDATEPDEWGDDDSEAWHWQLTSAAALLGVEVKE